MMSQAPNSRSKPKGIFVTLDELNYTYQPTRTPPGKPHVFTYHLTIHNQSERTIRVLARKWVLTYIQGGIDVIEGDKVVGKTPELPPGQSFSYTSFHLVAGSASTTGAFQGVDDTGTAFSIPIVPFELQIPGESGCN